MKVFVTGASGWIGSAAVAELLERGHEVAALARSDASAAAVEAAGARAVRGELTDVEVIRRAAGDADGVVHLGFVHDFTNYEASGRIERAVVEAYGEALAGSDRPLVIASGLAGFGVLGRPIVESDVSGWIGPDAPRGGSEQLALSFAERGIRSVSVRFAPTVHGVGGDHGFMARLADIARSTGVAGYPGDGTNRWPAVNRLDAGRLVALALESAPAGSVVHAVAEEGIPMRRIAELLGAALALPVGPIDEAQLAERFGWLARFVAADLPASSARTRELLGWEPTHPTLAEDIAAGGYGTAARLAG
ncbi:SDR family oxidoreductase [Protaetiibacter intestinalis]|uniref:SDR family oxidoreductase n=1 Tax=Protaetiibacter intestinalis TaxID=2419774 RepID=A0A387B6V0_9MICO|nr:SDR family oxidoreductase [Protaetiibacter intestinalis]AYF96925.1 SDR family oxidoreductase [Protaetiibacter intestinalis]